jgi:hypothetical protein
MILVPRFSPAAASPAPAFPLQALASARREIEG